MEEIKADQICLQAVGRAAASVCRYRIGVVLDAELRPVEPKRAARLEDC